MTIPCVTPGSEAGTNEASQSRKFYLLKSSSVNIMMPVMDGLTLWRKIKSNPKTSHIGIILATAKKSNIPKIEGIKMGTDAYLTKPFEMELLDASIDHLLKRKQKTLQLFQI